MSKPLITDQDIQKAERVLKEMFTSYAPSDETVRRLDIDEQYTLFHSRPRLERNVYVDLLLLRVITRKADKHYRVHLFDPNEQATFDDLPWVKLSNNSKYIPALEIFKETPEHVKSFVDNYLLVLQAEGMS